MWKGSRIVGFKWYQYINKISWEFVKIMENDGRRRYKREIIKESRTYWLKRRDIIISLKSISFRWEKKSFWLKQSENVRIKKKIKSFKINNLEYRLREEGIRIKYKYFAKIRYSEYVINGITR